ncbi:hypothetical protein ES703_35875 [subsurface metagenome]
MGGKQINKKQYTGKITSGIQSRTFQLAIINFVHRQLPFWRDDPDRPFEQSEPKLNSQLSKFLNSQARKILSMICFNHEEPQYGTRDIDISVSPDKKMIIEAQTYTKYDLVLVIECKRLPARSLDYEKEYVTGTEPNKISGGIQRFKLGFHGAKHNLAAMIGYIQDRFECDWHATINGWISELVSHLIGDGCIWTADETLKAFERDTSRGIYSYRSIHSRTGDLVNNEIELHHLWVTMNVEN